MPKRLRKGIGASTASASAPEVKRKRTSGIEQNRFRRWSRQEDDFILAQCLVMTDGEMARVLGRSRTGVLLRRLKVLGVRKKASLSIWTEEEDAMLWELYGTVDTDFLAAVLDRRPEALWGRAFYLNLRSRNTWSLAEDEILRTHYPRAPVPDFAGLLPGRSPRNIYHRAGVLALERSHSYVFSAWRLRFNAYPPELRSLIRLHNQAERKVQDVQAQY